MALLAAKPRRLCPVLTLDVIDHGALFPSQQRWDHKTDAFATTRWREGENVFGAIMTEVIQSVSALMTPATDVDTVLCCEQSCIAHIVLVGPSRRAVKVLGVLRELACSAVCEDKEDADTEQTAREDDHFPLEEWLANPLIARSAILPSPDDPGKGLVDSAGLRPENRCAQCWLVLESSGNILRGDELHDKQQKASEHSRTPVITAEVARFSRNTVEFRLFLPHGRASSTVPFRPFAPPPEFADRALGIGVVDAHAF